MSAPDADGWSPPRTRVHSIAIELTGFCNQTCDYCFNAFREDGGASVGSATAATTLARIDRILDAVDVEHVTLTGGEPLASHDVFAVLDGLRLRSVRAQIITNATLVTDAVAARLARYRLLAVLVTLNGPEASVHDELVRAEGHFDKTVQGIARLVARRVPVQGSIVVTAHNAARVGETVALFARLGVRSIALSRFSPAGYSARHAAALLASPAHVVTAFEQASRAIAGTGVTLFATMPVPPCVVDPARFPAIAVNHCPIGTARQEFALGPRGDLRHCALHGEPLVRDVMDPDADLARALAAGDPHGYRRALPLACEGCEHAAECGGGCGAAAWWVFGSRARRDPFVDGVSAPRRALPVIA